MGKRSTLHTAFLLIFLDVAFWAISTFVLMFWRIVADKMIITRYLLSYLTFAGVWILVGLMLKKYTAWKKVPVKKTFFRLVLIFLITIAYAAIHHKFLYPDLSIYALGGVVVGVALLNSFVLLCYYGYRYATFMDVEPKRYAERAPQNVLSHSEDLSDEQYQALQNLIQENAGEQVWNVLQENLPLRSSNTLVTQLSRRFNIETLTPYKYDCIVNLLLLNDIVGVNKFFCAVNEKLPDNGLWVCTFFTHDVYQREILKKYPPVIRRIVWAWNVFLHRIIPQSIAFQRIYYRWKRSNKRFFSRTEILGRLVYCGFEIERELQVGTQTFVIARRKSVPYVQENKRYGFVIKLPRIGKNGEFFDVYKYRTMYPYAEYVQEYVYQQNDLSQGGKFKNDKRITAYGRFMRKYWIDELPMFINLLKGDMKIVGVRPLSKHYFGLYSKELQDLRTKFRPGLLPPFYADMPETLDEIQASEMKYLKECESKGVFVTDFKYFWKILSNILFKKARSK